MKKSIENSQNTAYFQATESYSILVWADGHKLMKSRPIKFYADSLEAQGWCRIHRSYMVNPDFISQIMPDREHILLNNGTQLPIARRKIKSVLVWRKNYCFKTKSIY